MIADFLILDPRLPRSLLYCLRKIATNMSYLSGNYGQRSASLDMASTMRDALEETSIDEIFESGLHEFLMRFVNRNTALARQIEKDYRFYE